MNARWLWLAAATVGCSAPRPDAAAAPGDAPVDTVMMATPSPPSVTLVDSGEVLAAGGTDGWNELRSTHADLDGDGSPERVVVLAQVELVRGRPAWDDGQRWQVVVERVDGRRDLAYARYVQLGTVTMRLTPGTPGEPRRIVLLEQMPDRMSVYEIAWTPGAGSAASIAYQQHLDATGDTTSN